MAKIEFDAEREEGKQAIVVSFDLEGFSNFCNQADAYAVLNRFVSALFDEVNRFFLHWVESEIMGSDFEKDKLRQPDSMKYTGDGAVMLWLLPENTDGRQKYCAAVVQAMRKLRDRLAQIIPKWGVERQVHSLPYRARFGIAIGLVYPLRPKPVALLQGPAIDYVGYCINLAVRLQNHCPEIGFLVHATALPQSGESFKVVAHGMRGVRDEPVLIQISDFPEMTVPAFKSKFLPTGEEPDAGKTIVDGNPLCQPRFEAHFLGPGGRSQIMFLDRKYPEFIPIRDVADQTGAVVRKEKTFYRLTSKGPPLLYQFVRAEPA